MRASSRIGRVAVAVLVACGLLAAAAFPAAAAATRGLITGIHADEYVDPYPDFRALWLDRTVESGAGLVRLTISWSKVAGDLPAPDPTNPGSTSYDFGYVDRAVRDLEARGLTVVLNLGANTPLWAEEPGRPASFPQGRWRPANPADFANFVKAVAARYSGNFAPPDGSGLLPHVEALEIWNEPNGEPWMSPQYGGTPDYYRTMLNLSYGAVKSVSPQTLVVAGGTSPYGDPPGGPYPASGGRVYPVDFWERVLCVHSVKAKKGKKGKKAKKAKRKFVRTQNCSSPAMFDVFAHHPIDNTGGPPTKSAPTKGHDVSTPDLGLLTAVLRGAERAGTVSPGGNHPIWVTEFWWDSNPPNPSGAPLSVQARWVEQSLYLFWKAGASAAVNFTIRDTDFRSDVHAGYQAGIFFRDGTPKPSFTAFRFPLVAERIDKGSLLVWGKAPAAGKLVIQRRQKGRWIAAKKLSVGQGAVFTAKLRLSGKQQLRAAVAGNRSLVWNQR
jgi:hypothetical protein